MSLLLDSTIARLTGQPITRTLWPPFGTGRPFTVRRESNQVEQFLQAAREDEIGRYAVGAMERVVAASEEATKTIKSSTTR